MHKACMDTHTQTACSSVLWRRRHSVYHCIMPLCVTGLRRYSFLGAVLQGENTSVIKHPMEHAIESDRGNLHFPLYEIMEVHMEVQKVSIHLDATVYVAIIWMCAWVLIKTDKMEWVWFTLRSVGLRDNLKMLTVRYLFIDYVHASQARGNLQTPKYCGIS